MKRLIVCAALALGACGAAQATGRLADVSIIDRDTGNVLPLHYHGGEYWVAGTPGHRYSIQVASRYASRVLAVMSVDGLNVLTGDTARFDQRGYVYDPWQSYPITGWRKSSTEVAAFTFTALPNSYAARTGRPANVGVIGVALFRERPQPVPYESQATDAAASRAQALEAPAAAGAGARTENSADAKASRGQPAAEPALPRLGTGHGPREESRVQHVDFERESPQPNEIIRIRYDSYDNLLAMGVIRRGRVTPDAPAAFPGEVVAGYVPDP